MTTSNGDVLAHLVYLPKQPLTRAFVTMFKSCIFYEKKCLEITYFSYVSFKMLIVK